MANLQGRTQIFSSITEIDDSNIVDILKKAYRIHKNNRKQIDKLYGYYKGKQKILNRIKEVRPEINNKIVVNKANEIVTFKTGYLLYSPVQYVSRVDNSGKAISTLNTYMDLQGKITVDKDIVDWMHICGTAYRIALPNLDLTSEIPFVLYSCDPRNTFVIYSNVTVANEPIMAVTYFIDDDKKEVFECYTKDRYYKIENDKIVDKDSTFCGGIPIIEYPLNKARIGSFELVMDLLDSINSMASNRADGVEQFVQSLLLFHNVDVDEEQVKVLRDLGAIKFRDSGNLKGEITYLIQQLDQTNTQTLVDSMANDILAIVGMPPTSHGGGSTKDTGQAVVLRDGWYLAETRAKDTENIFKFSEYRFLKIIEFICNNSSDLKLDYKNIEIKFTRKNYENIQSKVNVLNTMLKNDKIAPRLAFVTSNLFPDGENAYNESLSYMMELNAQKEQNDENKIILKTNKQNSNNSE